jgi:hypothetical protein
MPLYYQIQNRKVQMSWSYINTVFRRSIWDIRCLKGLLRNTVFKRSIWVILASVKWKSLKIRTKRVTNFYQIFLRFKSIIQETKLCALGCVSKFTHPSWLQCVSALLLCHHLGGSLIKLILKMSKTFRCMWFTQHFPRHSLAKVLVVVEFLCSLSS